MDLVGSGPLPRTATGNKFILVICDYATQHPETIALPDITAETVAEHLITLFTRVGIPAEILNDQGANFMSALLKALYKRLNIKSIRTSPYHPQSDGLVERFNQTLKAMLRKFVSENNHNWDKDLPYLLFAYREVPQASTGFSPFELLYGRSVTRGRIIFDTSVLFSLNSSPLASRSNLANAFSALVRSTTWGMSSSKA